MTERIEYTIKKPSQFVIDNMQNIENKSKFLNDLLEDYFKGKLIQGNDIDVKIKNQQYLKLCLANWQSLKSSGHIYEEIKAIITGEKKYEAPTLQDKKELAEPKANRDCHFCHHQHSDEPPHKCLNENCLCGIRG